MTRIAKAVLAAAIVSSALLARAADKPDYSGQWKLNVAKSDFGPLPAPESITREVSHADPALSIVERQRSAFGDQSTTRKYTTDGKEITFDANGTEVKSAVVWEGDALLITSRAKAGGADVEFKDKMVLSDGGKTLTSLVHIVSPQGEVDIKAVFDKQEDQAKPDAPGKR